MNLEEKIKQSIGLIKEYAPFAEKGNGYVVGFSGGKDSSVVYQLFIESGVPFRAVYNVTTIDPPESVNFIRKQYPNVEFSIPKLNFFKLVEKKKNVTYYESKILLRIFQRIIQRLHGSWCQERGIYEKEFLRFYHAEQQEEF